MNTLKAIGAIYLLTALIVPSLSYAKTQELYTVVKVIDGDTVDVQLGSKTERLRLIGVDTPETVDPRKPVQCFGKEASAYTKKALLGKQVSLTADPTQGERDKYRRLLRYVLLNGINYNKRLIAEGYAHEYTYNIPYKYQALFKTTQKTAQASKKGLWAPNTCSNKTASNSKTIAASPVQPPIKKSVNGLCHAKGERHYDQTKKFTSYKTTKECLTSGGKLPSN